MVTSSYTILIVEDDLALSEMYSLKFKHEGFNVIVASNGAKAVDVVMQTHIDFVLLDMMLPVFTGQQFLKQIHNDSRNADLPIIVLSNLTDQNEAKVAIENYGVKEYLAKAMFTPEQIVEKVKRYLA